jgi:hypothetical protein
MREEYHLRRPKMRVHVFITEDDGIWIVRDRTFEEACEAVGKRLGIEGLAQLIRDDGSILCYSSSNVQEI